MEEIKEKTKSFDEEDNEDHKNNNINCNNLLQKPYDFMKEIIRAILRCRCLGFEEPSDAQRSADTPSEPTASTSTSTSTTTDDGGGGGAVEDDDETTCPEEEPTLPTPPPQQGGSCGEGGGGDGGDGDGGSTDPAVGAEPVDGSESSVVSPETRIRKPPTPPVSSGKDPQIH